MPGKHPNTNRHHGGPGSSHENADKSAPEPARSGSRDNNPPAPGAATSGDSSHVSGGGGERDKHHTHDPKTKS